MLGNKIANLSKPQCYLVRGTFNLALIDYNDAVVSVFKDVGTVSEITLTPANDKIEKKEYQSGKNNTVCENVISSDVEVSIVFTDLSSENIARFVYGDLVNNAASAAQTITKAVKIGGSTPLGKVLTDTTAIVVTDNATGAITYEEGKNYEISGGSIYVYSDAEQTANGAANNISEDEVLDIVADLAEYDNIQAFTKSDLKLAGYFEGVNSAMGDKTITFDFPKMSFDPAELSVITPEEYGEVTVSGKLLLARGKTYLFEVNKQV